MRVCAIAGGVGSARFCAGLVRVIDPDDLTVVSNTGDDDRMQGLYVCPDIDTLLYHLAGLADWERGWGVASETYRSHERYVELAARAGVPGTDLHEWFTLGDTDLATNLLRTRLLDAGRPLHVAVAAVGRALGVRPVVLPMSDDAVRTRLETAAGEVLDFQTYFVRRRHTDEVRAVRFEGAENARPSPGVVEAIAAADVVVIPPSNPIVSVAPVLAVPGVRDAVAATDAVRVAVSPIVSGRALKGPADMLMRSLGHAQDAVGVARIYEGLVDAFVLDEQDAALAPKIEALGMRAVVCDTIMSSPDAAGGVAKSVLGHV